MEPCGTKTPGRGESRHQNCLTRRAPYKLFALVAYNLANFLWTLALPDEVARWTLTTLREKLIKIGARIAWVLRRAARPTERRDLGTR